MSTYRLKQGLNEPVEDFPSNYDSYSVCCDGKLVYVDPNGSIDGISENTKLRYIPVKEIYITLKDLIPSLPKNFTFIFLITNNASVIVNMDCVKNITNTIFFIGAFDSDGKYINAHDIGIVHQYCVFSTRAEALTNTDSSIIHILPKLTKDEAKAAFERKEDIICLRENELPERIFNFEHANIRNALSGTQNSFQCFVRLVSEMIKSDLDKNDYVFMEFLNQKIPEAVFKLNSIQCQTNWEFFGTKLLNSVKILMKIKSNYQQGKEVKIPDGFHNMYNMKIPRRGFLGKLFYNHNKAFKMLNKIESF